MELNDYKELVAKLKQENKLGEPSKIFKEDLLKYVILYCFFHFQKEIIAINEENITTTIDNLFAYEVLSEKYKSNDEENYAFEICDALSILWEEYIKNES